MRTGTIMLVGAVLGANVLLAAQAARAPAPPAGDHTGQVRELRSALQALSGRLARDEAGRGLPRAAAPPVTPEPPPQEIAALPSAAAPAPPKGAAAAEQADRRYRERLEARFTGERPDPRW